MYTKLAMIEEALKKKRQAEDKKLDASAAPNNQCDAGNTVLLAYTEPTTRD